MNISRIKLQREADKKKVETDTEVESFCQEYQVWQQFWGDDGCINQELLTISAMSGTGTILLFYLWQDSANELYPCSAAQVIPPPANCKVTDSIPALAD